MTVKISPDTKFAVCGGFDGKLKIFDWYSKELKYIYDEDESLICSSYFSSDGQFLFIGGED